MGYVLLFGGNSFEHEISIVSAISLKNELEIAHFVFLDAGGGLFLIEPKNMKSSYFASGAYKRATRLGFAHGGFKKHSIFNAILGGIFGESFGATIAKDCVVVNLIHGKSGEDGQIAGILDFFDIPFVGPRIEGCSVSFNKALTKIYAKARAVAVLDYKILRKNEKFAPKESDLPLILKPARLGSSIGISIVKSLKDAPYALDCAFEYDDTIVLEGFCAGVEEYNLAGCAVGGEFIFSNIERVKKAEFLDFEKKYLDFSGVKKPKNAEIDEGLARKLKEAFKKIYTHTFEGALIRCDFFVLNNEVFLNEINPIPGSMASYLFDDFPAVLARLSSALPRAQKIKIQYKYIHKIQAQKGK